MKVFGHVLFWGWNGLFLWFVALGLGPAVLAGLFVAVLAGMIPWHVGAVGLAILVLPIAGMLVGLRLRHDPGRLLSLLYGVEFPLFVVLLVRLFAVGQLTAPIALALAVVLLGAAGLLRTLLHGPSERTAPRQAARLVAQSAWLAGGLWIAAFGALHAVPMAGWILWELGSGRWATWAFGSPYVLVAGSAAFAFLSLTALVFLVFPVAAFGIAIRAWQLVHRATAERMGRRPAAVVSAGTLAAVVGGFWAVSDQPQGRAFALLDAATDDAGRRAALADAETVRLGLVNARLAEERWLDPGNDLLRDLWSDAALPQAVGAWLLHPFVYHPVASVALDSSAARERYAAFFDAPIERAERETLLRAARNTWSWESAEAGLLEIGEQKVHLASQEVVVVPHGDLARVTVHDVYRNRTWSQEEVLVYFSLPETAAVTGLWLGTDPDREEAFRFVVAPRGAAQEVYEGERVQRRDPALVEQVGPRQYRLRAYPVLPRTGDPGRLSSITGEGPDLHLWLEVVVPVRQDVDGVPYYPLPRASEVRNLFWDADTERVVDRASAAHDAWLPESIPAPGRALAQHVAVVGGFEVRATPAEAAAPRRLGPVAVLVDGTRSMDAHREEVASALRQLAAAAERLDVLCTVEQRVARCPDFSAADALFWGARPLEAQIAEAAASVGRDEVIVVVTDASGPETAVATRLGPAVLPPLWLVHLGGLPHAYADWTLDRVHETGGGVVESIDELLVRLADPSVADGWRWEVSPTTAASTATGPFEGVAARRAIAHADHAARGQALAELDRLHALAREAEVVTPYSSMLVLVDDAQRRLLAAAEGRADRFDREAIDQPLDVSSAPEPATWALLGVGAALAAVGRRRRSRDDGSGYGT